MHHWRQLLFFRWGRITHHNRCRHGSISGDNNRARLSQPKIVAFAHTIRAAIAKAIPNADRPDHIWQIVSIVPQVEAD